MHPNFPDPPTSPFFAQVELIPAYFGLNADTVAEIAGIGVAAAVGVHAVHHALAKKKREQTETSERRRDVKGDSQ
jgi:Ni,Fe-hydrogenase I small subunit